LYVLSLTIGYNVVLCCKQLAFASHDHHSLAVTESTPLLGDASRERSGAAAPQWSPQASPSKLMSALAASASPNSTYGVLLTTHTRKAPVSIVAERTLDDGDAPSFWVTSILFLILSFHSIVEGLALGVQSSIDNTFDVAVAIVAHKWVESFALGVSMIREHVPLRRMTILAAAYAWMTPLGGLIGMAALGVLQGPVQYIFTGIVTGFAAGTFVYVAVIDILLVEFESASHQYAKSVSTVFGFALMAFMSYYFHSH
jgi:zinc transporter ZupT